MRPLVQSYVHGDQRQAADRRDDRRVARPDRRRGAGQPARWSCATRASAGPIGELRRRADDLAAGLIGLGLEPGERIGIWSPNNAEWVLTQFATAKAGLILVNVNPAYRSHEFEYAMNKVGCKALILSAGFRGNDYIASLRALAPELDARAARAPRSGAASRSEDRHPAGRREDRRRPEFRRRRRRRPRRRELAELAALGKTLQFDDPINIQFTTGTTGAPKGATLTHHNILNNGYFIGEAMRLTPSRPAVHSRALLSLLRHGAGQSRLRHPRRLHGLSRPKGSMPLAVLRDGPGRAMHRRCTACPPCSSRLLDHPEFARLRPDQPAHRHHGRLALSGRSDAQRGLRA